MTLCTGRENATLLGRLVLFKGWAEAASKHQRIGRLSRRSIEESNAKMSRTGREYTA
jgi:hypothetical protein